MSAAPVTQVPGRRTPPWSWYTDPAILRREHERIFRRAWQYAGHLGELQGPGSYFASETGPVPVVVTLDNDGVLRGFLNVCRHRGAIVATDARRRSTLQCPYHAWTYGLDGCLRAAPRSGEDPAFDADGLGLVPVSVGTWGPFVFANPDPAAAPLAEALGDLPEVVAAHGLDIEALRCDRRVRYEIRANWKIALENYLECYHCQVNHPGLVEVIDERRLVLDPYGRRGSMYAPVHPKSLDGRGPIDAHGSLVEGQNHLWFPTLKFNVLPGHPNLSIGPLWPTGPETCAGYLDYWFGESADAEWIEELFVLDNQVGQEDTALVEAVQRGSSTGLVDRGWALGGVEALIVQFQDYLREELELDQDADAPG
ncbi:MAG TPA: aromatic ring-hydroxylating dioxygenase subunit alpha [Solirubrobacteraceae bacterium]|nr:aromatic ring-hydroxylating dioxygenase subunit alpha [Solirubrobacteraceae bacterium]HTX63520.1 aromatic ring-hydroxylating dioxygenase subunit alpha [Acidimicrobiales bacterium]